LPRRDARPDILTGGLSAILASSCCLGPPVRSAYKLLFWIVAALVVVALGFPYVLPFFY